MPILFLHGVAIRQEDEPEWAILHRLTRGVNWPRIEASLREHVAPVLQPTRPEAVEITFLYWGDLGARYALGGQFRGSQARQGQGGPERPGELDEQALGELLESWLRPHTPLAGWPELVEAVWAVARSEQVRERLRHTPPQEQWALLRSAVEARLAPAAPEGLWPQLSGGWEVQGRRSVQHALARMRRPLEDFLPIFVGDVLCYLNGRGSAEAPGPIARRVLTGLRAAHQARQESAEPLIVLTHSMGGQLLYDALTAFVPADPALATLRVDFWCAVGSQVGLFKELGLFLEDQPPSEGPPPHLGYFWNVWSSGDLLSFRTQGIVAGAHDTDFPLGSRLQGEHVAYFHHPEFYRTLAAKIRVHVRPGEAPAGARG